MLMSKVLKIAKDLFDIFYPIGSYYETSNLTWTPQGAGWYGTWVEDSAGKTTVAQDTGTFKTLGGSVGAETKTTNSHVIAQNELPGRVMVRTQDAANSACTCGAVTTGGWSNHCLQDAGLSSDRGHNHGNINVIQPSIVVRRWHRTA